MNKKKLPGNISLPGNFFLFMRIIRLYLGIFSKCL